MDSEETLALLGIILLDYKEEYTFLKVGKSEKYPAYGVNVPEDLEEDFLFLKILNLLFSNLGFSGPFKTRLNNGKLSYQWWDLYGEGHGKEDDSMDKKKGVA